MNEVIVDQSSDTPTGGEDRAETSPQASDSLNKVDPGLNLGDLKFTLVKPNYRVWADDQDGDKKEKRETYLKGLYEYYFAIVKEFYNSANLSVNSYTKYSESHRKWRWIVILATGIVAVVNVVAAYVNSNGLGEGGWAGILSYFSLLAAIAAAILAILANLENFNNYLEKAHAYRESRELFLDAARDFEARWHAYVTPFYPNPKACLNAMELIQLINTRDSELRRKLKELTSEKGAKK